jgi:hypothetical protein
MLECIKDSNGRPVYYINEKRVNKITALAYAKSNNKKLPTFMRKGLREINKIEYKKVNQKNPNKLLEEIEILKKQIKQYQDENENLKNELFILNHRIAPHHSDFRDQDPNVMESSGNPEKETLDPVIRVPGLVFLNSEETSGLRVPTIIRKPNDWNNTQKQIFDIENKLLNKLESFIKDKNDITNMLEELNFNNDNLQLSDEDRDPKTGSDAFEEDSMFPLLNETEIEDFENIIYKIENNIKEAKYILKKISKIKRTFELSREDTGSGNFNNSYINNIINKALKFLKNIK